jgi:hypothetical protein
LRVRENGGKRRKVRTLVVNLSAYLEAKDFGLDEGEWFAVDFDKSFSFLLRRQYRCHHQIPFISISIFHNLDLEILQLSRVGV